jgi:hypothetical protein
MPDWFYRTVSRPLLYRLKPRTARAFALGFMSKLARLPLGPRVIDLLGHMRPDPRLRTTVLGIEFASPIGLGPRLDPQCIALPALERFGIGFADVGAATGAEVERDDEREDLRFPCEVACETAVLEVGPVPRIVRGTGDRQFLILLPDDEHAEAKVEAALATGFAGVLIDGVVQSVTGGSVRAAVREMVQRVRLRFPDVPIVAGGGVHEPEHALALLDAGANLVEVDTGLVFTGPGLVKRCNEALLHRIASREPETPPPRAARMTWFWTALLGLGMFIGGVLALAIASTRVVLPYDEAFLGMNREQIHAVNPKLLAFMAHDRVSLVGPMLALGTMYLGLSLGGIRRGMHWAMVAVITSSSLGFASFFLFLGFGYLDPLHAFVTACLFQLLLMAVHSELGEYRPAAAPLRTDRAWRLAQWGQLILVVHAIALLCAGTVIASFGVTSVFVHEDLEFMQTTVGQLEAANPRLIPMVAHDRATFGGMIVCSGLALLLTALWGIAAAREWLWWTLLGVCLAGYVPAIIVHLAVGYTDGMHLLPAFFGLGVFLLALALLRPHMCQRV